MVQGQKAGVGVRQRKSRAWRSCAMMRKQHDLGLMDRTMDQVMSTSVLLSKFFRLYSSFS